MVIMVIQAYACAWEDQHLGHKISLIVLTPNMKHRRKRKKDNNKVNGYSHH